jgi:hypothetical protein
MPQRSRVVFHELHSVRVQVAHVLELPTKQTQYFVSWNNAENFGDHTINLISSILI